MIWNMQRPGGRKLFQVPLNFSKKGQKIPSDAQASMRAEMATVRQTPQLRGNIQPISGHGRGAITLLSLADTRANQVHLASGGSRHRHSGQQISPFDQRTWVVWEGEAMATLISQGPRLSSWARQMQAGRKGARAGAD